MSNTYTPELGAWIHRGSDGSDITYNGKVVAIASLPEDVQHSIRVLNEWQAEANAKELRLAQVRHAIEHLKVTIAARLDAIAADEAAQPQVGQEDVAGPSGS